MKELIFNNNYFGIIISVFAFYIGFKIYSKFRTPLFNPFLLAVSMIILFMLILGIKTEYYMKGGSILSFFLAPATVILAVPLYNQFELLKKHFIPILAGIVTGSITAVLSVISLSKLLGLDKKMLLSLIPKSITTPIAIELSKSIGGIVPITVVSLVITGILGAVALPSFLKLLRITNPIAVGVAIGTASHAVGTSKAVELGETEGAMSSLSIGIAGLVTVLITPVVVLFL